jgi:hypothetical protein
MLIQLAPYRIDRSRRAETAHRLAQAVVFRETGRGQPVSASVAEMVGVV